MIRDDPAWALYWLTHHSCYGFNSSTETLQVALVAYAQAHGMDLQEVGWGNPEGRGRISSGRIHQVHLGEGPLAVLEALVGEEPPSRPRALGVILEWFCDQAALRPTQIRIGNDIHLIGTGIVPAPRPYPVPALRTQDTRSGPVHDRLGDWPNPDTGEVPGGPDRAAIYIDGHLHSDCCTFHQIAPIRTAHGLPGSNDDLTYFFKEVRREASNLGVSYYDANDIALRTRDAIADAIPNTPHPQVPEEHAGQRPFTDWIVGIRDAIRRNGPVPDAVPLLPSL